MKTRSLCMLGAGLFGILVLGLPAQAHEETPADASASNLVVVKDAVTGELRAPTADEAAALLAAKPAADRTSRSKSLAPQQRLSRRHADGSVSVRVTDADASYAVAVRQADGSLAEACVQGSENTEKALQSGPAVTPTTRSAEK